MATETSDDNASGPSAAATAALPATREGVVTFRFDT